MKIKALFAAFALFAATAYGATIVGPPGGTDTFSGVVSATAIQLGGETITNWAEVAPTGGVRSVVLNNQTNVPDQNGKVDLGTLATTGVVKSITLNNATNVPGTNGAVDIGDFVPMTMTPDWHVGRLGTAGGVRGRLGLFDVEGEESILHVQSAFDMAPGLYLGLDNKMSLLAISETDDEEHLIWEGLVNTAEVARIIEQALVSSNENAGVPVTVYTSDDDERLPLDLDVSYDGMTFAYLQDIGGSAYEDKLIVSYDAGATLIQMPVNEPADDYAGTRLAMSGDGRTMVVDDGPDGETLLSTEHPPNFIGSGFQRSEDYFGCTAGTLFGAALGDEYWFTDDNFVNSYRANNAGSGDMAISGDGRVVWARYADGFIAYSLDRGHTFNEPGNGYVMDDIFACSADGRKLIGMMAGAGYLAIGTSDAGPGDMTFVYWGDEIFSEQIPPSAWDDNVRSADMSDDGNTIAVHTWSGSPVDSTFLWYTTDYATWQSINFGRNRIYRLAVSGDGRYAYVVTRNPATSEPYLLRRIALGEVRKDLTEAALSGPAGTPGLAFSPNDRGGYDIAGYSGTNTSVVLPPYHLGLPVHSVRGDAFGMRTIETLESHVPEIGISIRTASPDGGRGAVTLVSSAFSGSSALRSVTLHAAKSIGQAVSPLPSSGGPLGGVFSDCTALESVSAPLAELAAPNAFKRSAALTNIYMPRLRVVGRQAFAQITTPFNIDFPAAAHIGRGAFSESAVVDAKLPVAETIMGGAFYRANAMTNLYAPRCLYVGDKAMPRQHDSEVSALSELYLPSALYVGSGNFHNELVRLSLPSAKFVRSSCMGLSLLEYVNMPKLVSVPDAMFWDCSALTQVRMPALERAGANAFRLCSALTEIELGSLRTAGLGLFRDCSALERVSLRRLEKISSKMFANTALRTVLGYKHDGAIDPAAYIPEATHIGVGAFSGCSALQDVRLPKVKRVERNAFGSSNTEYQQGNPAYIVPCLALTNVYFSAATYVGGGAFGQTAVEQAHINNALYIGGYAFAHTPISRSYYDEEEIYADVVETNYVYTNTLSGLTLLMKSTTPTIWNTTVGADTNAAQYARPVSSVPNAVGVRMAWTGGVMDIEVPYAALTGCYSNSTSHLMWGGDNDYRYGGYHFGIGAGYTDWHDVADGDIVVLAGPGCGGGSDRLGWGWGHPAGLNNRTGFGWYGLDRDIVPVPTCSVYVATQVLTAVAYTNITTNNMLVGVATNFHLNLPSAQRIGAYAFYDTPALRRVTAPAVHSVGWGGTFVSSGVEDVYMPSLRSVPDNMFVGAHGLTNFTWHDTVPVSLSVSNAIAGAYVTNLTDVYAAEDENQTALALDTDYDGDSFAYIQEYYSPGVGRLVVGLNGGADVTVVVTDDDDPDATGRDVAITDDGSEVYFDAWPDGAMARIATSNLSDIVQLGALGPARFSMSGDGEIGYMWTGYSSSSYVTTNNFASAYEQTAAPQGFAVLVSPDGSRLWMDSDDQGLLYSDDYGVSFTDANLYGVTTGQDGLRCSGDGTVLLQLSGDGYLRIVDADLVRWFWGEDIFSGEIDSDCWDGGVVDADISQDGQTMVVLTYSSAPRLYFTRNFADWDYVNLDADLLPSHIALSGNGRVAYIAAVDSNDGIPHVYRVELQEPDVSEHQTLVGTWHYYGAPDADGSYRAGVGTNGYVVQQRVAGAWADTAQGLSADGVLALLTNVTTDVNLWGTNHLDQAVLLAQDGSPGALTFYTGEDVAAIQLAGVYIPGIGLGIRRVDIRYPGSNSPAVTPLITLNPELYGQRWSLKNTVFENEFYMANTGDETLFQLTIAGDTFSMGYPDGDGVYPLATWSDLHGWMWEGGITENAEDYLTGELNFLQSGSGGTLVLPTSTNGLPPGSLWNSNGVPAIVPAP